MLLTHSLKIKTKDHHLNLQMMKKYLSLVKQKKLKKRKPKNNLKTKRFGIKTLRHLEHLSVELRTLIFNRLMIPKIVKERKEIKND
jgi:hypothetical protein